MSFITKEFKVKEPLSQNSTLQDKELKDQVKVLKNFVCLIKVY